MSRSRIGTYTCILTYVHNGVVWCEGGVWGANGRWLLTSYFIYRCFLLILAHIPTQSGAEYGGNTNFITGDHCIGRGVQCLVRWAGLKEWNSARNSQPILRWHNNGRKYNRRFLFCYLVSLVSSVKVIAGVDTKQEREIKHQGASCRVASLPLV